MNAKRVVITGAGPVSAIGIGREAFADGLRRGVGAIRNVTAFDISRYAAAQAAEIADFDVEEYLESQKAYLDRSSQLAFAAMSLALEDADLDPKSLNRDTTGLTFGTAFGCLGTMGLFFDDFLKKGARFVKPVLFPHTYANTTISLLAMEYNLSGPHMCFASGATAGAQALLCAYDWIGLGKAAVCLAGASESLNEFLFAGYDRLAKLARRDKRAAPFDKQRSGFALGEGGAMLVLEAADHAAARGARVLGELRSASTVSDSAVDTDSASADGGIRRAMTQALSAAGLKAGDLDYISANANGSVNLDRNETMALRALLADAGKSVPVSSIKSLIGETLGAAGPLQLAAVLAAMESGGVPGTANLVTPMNEASSLCLVDSTTQSDVRLALMNTIDPGGSIVSLVVGKKAI
jgi:3-oxoacyl-[acyl-carrier-protein] synthase II